MPLLPKSVLQHITYIPCSECPWSHEEAQPDQKLRPFPISSLTSQDGRGCLRQEDNQVPYELGNYSSSQLITLRKQVQKIYHVICISQCQDFELTLDIPITGTKWNPENTLTLNMVNQGVKTIVSESSVL